MKDEKKKTWSINKEVSRKLGIKSPNLLNTTAAAELPKA